MGTGIILQAAGLGIVSIVALNTVGESNQKAKYWIEIGTCVAGVIMFLTWISELWEYATPIFNQFGLN